MITRMTPTTTGTLIVTSISFTLLVSMDGRVMGEEVGIKLVSKNEDERKNTGVVELLEGGGDKGKEDGCITV